MTDSSPSNDAERYLRIAKAEQRGRLTVYLGAAPGGGKTQSMSMDGGASGPVGLRLRHLTEKKKDEPVSHDYETEESRVWRAAQRQMSYQDRWVWWTTGKKRAFKVSGVLMLTTAVTRC